MVANDEMNWPAYEPLLAGTVALMTFFPDQSTSVVARRIANNLLLLARHPDCGSERLRHVLLRAREHWVQRSRTPDEAARAAERTADRPAGPASEVEPAPDRPPVADARDRDGDSAGRVRGTMARVLRLNARERAAMRHH